MKIILIIAMVVMFMTIISRDIPILYKDSLIEMKDITAKLKLLNMIGISKAEFFYKDEKIIFSTSCCGIFIYNISDDKIEYYIKEDNISGDYCHGAIEGYANPYTISSDASYLATSACYDRKEYVIQVFSLINYSKIAQFNTYWKIKGAPPDAIGLHFSIDRENIFAVIPKNDPRVIGICSIKGWNLYTQKIILDKDIFIEDFCDCIGYISIMNQDKLIYNNRNDVRIYDISNLQLTEELIKEKYFLQSIVTDKNIYLSIEDNNKTNENSPLNKTYRIIIYNFSNKKKSSLLNDLINMHIEKIVNDRILIFTEEKYKKRKKIIQLVNENSINNRFNEKSISYYDIDHKTLIARIKFDPRCRILAISNKGNIWIMSCENENHKIKYYLAYPNIDNVASSN